MKSSMYVLAVVVTLGVATSAAATRVAETGRIAFGASGRGGNTDVYAIDPSGSGA